VTDWFGENAERLSSVAAALLGWRPDEFWNATPAELATVLQPPTSGEGADRATLEVLRRQFPDDEER
jgi:uncharacterized phage protein (TIGR02216 family)